MKKMSAKNIELPPSMVSPSRCCNEDWVVIVIKNVFPSKKNWKTGNFHDPNEKDPSVSQLKWLKRTAEFSDMYQRLFRGFGVSKKVLDRYYNQMKRSAAAIKHSHLVVSCGTHTAFCSGSDCNFMPILPQSFQSLWFSSHATGRRGPHRTAASGQSIYLWLRWRQARCPKALRRGAHQGIFVSFTRTAAK